MYIFFELRWYFDYLWWYLILLKGDIMFDECE